MTAFALDMWPHPTLAVAAFLSDVPVALAELKAIPTWASYLRVPHEIEVPLRSDEALRTAIRDLLRVGGYRPSGRAKPSSEYLARAAAEGSLASINPLVDACNITSLHSGLPISVIDLDRAKAPFALGVVTDDVSYVFNASGQEIALKGLLCLHDAAGPCANPVKDAQRTKTCETTRRTLSVIWGAKATHDQTQTACQWYRELLHAVGVATERVA